MTHFKYVKDNGDTSEREVIPIGFNFGNRDRVLCIDLSEFTGKELSERKRIVEELRREFINAIKDSELDNCYRQFFLDSIEDVE